jgi:hypothetical protein
MEGTGGEVWARARMRVRKSSAIQRRRKAEVVAGGGEDGVDAITPWSLEIVTAYAVLGHEMADDGLDGGAALHLAAVGGGDPANLAGDPDPELVSSRARPPIALEVVSERMVFSFRVDSIG